MKTNKINKQLPIVHDYMLYYRTTSVSWRAVGKDGTVSGFCESDSKVQLPARKRGCEALNGESACDHHECTTAV